MSTPPFLPFMCLPGFHTYQRMIGCELLEDGSTTGFLQYAYDGQDFLIFNKDTLSWMAMDNVADIIRRAWEANRHELQYQKNWLEEECIAWLPKLMSIESVMPSSHLILCRPLLLLPAILPSIRVFSNESVRVSCCVLCLVHLCLTATPWTIVYQAPLSMGILQASILEWVAMSSSGGSSQPRD